MVGMTELEIVNFALDFNNLIQQKNNEIAALKSENIRLKAIVRQLEESSRILTEEEIREGERPVYCFHTKQGNAGFWGVPLRDRMGVISSTKGIYRYINYGKTWYALSVCAFGTAGIMLKMREEW
ncbi:MAG: hypothetical protein A4E56_00157 [Pelotomaculum sp. PtaU1.Bin065]|nr:MAG: hypothetical protein A4E56_00157 [Pelotomaculum sp. PtaU1.Bin065]